MKRVINLCGKYTLSPHFNCINRRIQILNLSFLQHSLLTNFVKSQTITYPRKYLILPGFQNHRNSIDLRLMIELKGAIFPIPLINFDTRILDFKFRMICKVLNTSNNSKIILLSLLDHIDMTD